MYRFTQVPTKLVVRRPIRMPIRRNQTNVTSKNKQTTGKTEMQETVSVGNDGREKITKTVVTRITETWGNVSPVFKWSLYGYVAGGMSTNLYMSYNGGKLALEQYRNMNPGEISYKFKNVTSDWEAVYVGCKENSWNKFWNSVVWPAHIAESVMPSVVLWLNPQSNQKTKTK